MEAGPAVATPNRHESAPANILPTHLRVHGPQEPADKAISAAPALLSGLVRRPGHIVNVRVASSSHT